MARTHGHGNPIWTWDETILALALYLESGGTIPSRTDPKVRELSDLLRTFPVHNRAFKKESFRNSDGVAFKLQNLHNVATGKGLRNVSEMDRLVWSEFGSHPDKLKDLAELIRSGIKTAETLKESTDTTDGDIFFEGRILTLVHKRRERDPKIRKRLLALKKRLGALSCDLCGKHGQSADPTFGDAIFEAHHTIPIGMTAARVTRIEDLALVCANCHRLIHKVISIEKRWLTIDECKAVFRNG